MPIRVGILTVSDRSFRGKREDESGPLIRKIVQEHGGRISWESTPGEGTVFRLIFPRRKLPALDPPRDPAEGPDGNGDES